MGWMGCDETYTAKGTSQLSHFRACSGSIERFSPSISRELSPVPIAIGSACYVWATPTQTTSLHDADLGDGPGDSQGAWRSTNRAARDGAVAVPTEKKKNDMLQGATELGSPSIGCPARVITSGLFVARHPQGVPDQGSHRPCGAPQPMESRGSNPRQTCQRMGALENDPCAQLSSLHLHRT